LPTRIILPGATISQRNVAPLGAGSDATLTIEFNEQVVSPGSGIQVNVGGQTLTGGTRQRPAPDGLPEIWTFTMSSAFLQSLPNATNTITINATNRFASNLAIDGDPSSMAFRGYDGTLNGCDAATTPGAPSGDSLANFTIAPPTPPSLSCSGPGPQWNSPSVITCKASASGGTVTLPGTVTYRSPDGSQVTSQITVAGAGCRNYPVTATASSGLSTTVTVPVVNNTISLNPPVYTLTPSNSSVFVGVYASNCDTVPHSVYLYNPAYSAQSQPGILLPWLTGLTNFNGEYQDVVPPSSSNALVDGLAFGYYFDGPLPASGATGNKFPYALVPENRPVDNPAPLLASNVLPADAMNGEVDEDPAPHPDDTLTLTTPQFPDPRPAATNSSIGADEVAAIQPGGLLSKRL